MNSNINSEQLKTEKNTSPTHKCHFLLLNQPLLPTRELISNVPFSFMACFTEMLTVPKKTLR